MTSIALSVFLQLSGLIVQTQKPYVAFPLAQGTLMYIDRTYRFGAIPTPFTGAVAIRTANDDKGVATGIPLIGFKLSQDSIVYVLYSNVGSSLEGTWLTTVNGWILDSFTVPSDILEDSGNRRVRHKTFTKDSTVLLQGPASSGSMYNVVIVPAPVEQTVVVAPLSWDLCGEFVATGAFDAVKAELFVDDFVAPVNVWTAPPGAVLEYPIPLCRSLPGDFAGRSYKMRVVLTNSAGVAKPVDVTFP